jgi:hypothetical protein
MIKSCQWKLITFISLFLAGGKSDNKISSVCPLFFSFSNIELHIIVLRKNKGSRFPRVHGNKVYIRACRRRPKILSGGLIYRQGCSQGRHALGPCHFPHRFSVACAKAVVKLGGAVSKTHLFLCFHKTHAPRMMTELLLPPWCSHCSLSTIQRRKHPQAQFFLSATPFWGGVPEQVVWWIIPWFEIYDMNLLFTYSVPLSLWMIQTLALNWLATNLWKSWKHRRTSFLCLSMYTQVMRV